MSYVVQVLAPAGEIWNATLATPVPPSLAVASVTTAVPRITAPDAGEVSVAVGAVLSTVTATGALENVLVEPSVTTTRRLNEPLRPVVSQLAVYGALLDVEIDVQPTPLERWNSTEVTPLAASDALAASAFVVPCRIAPPVGDVTEPVGAVLSTVTATGALENVLVAASVTTTRRLNEPLRPVVSQLAV